MKKKQVTLLELAKRLNLSPSTVSRALNNRHRISEETRKRVKALAEELEYQPNPAAKNLRESRTYVIGVLIPQIANTFFATTISGIESVTLEAGYQIMICQSNESVEKEKAVAQSLLSNRVDGILYCPTGQTQEFKHLKSFLRKDIQVVFFDRISKDFEASKVVVNDFEGGVMAVDHLVQTGCKRIAHLAAPQPLYNGQERLNGYLEGLRKNNLPVSDELIKFCEVDSDVIQSHARSLLSMDNPPDAIFTWNDHVAYDVIRVAKNMNVRIGKDISLIGFGDLPSSTLVDPELTTVAQPAFELGKIAAQIMLKQLNKEIKEEDIEYQTVTLKTELKIRESTPIRKKHSAH